MISFTGKTKNLVAIAGNDNVCNGDGNHIAVSPGSLKEVQKIVKLANKHRFPLIPSSSKSAPSFLTSAEGPPVIVDMSRMNKILHLDKRNRAVMIEPGVGWGELQESLKRQGLRALMPLLPPKDKSAMTCVLDREPMLVPRYEYSEPILTMEIVLPNGDVFRTGSASGPARPDKTKAGMVGPYGPSVMDFFRLFQGARGSLGIATWINMKVEVLPPMEKLFIIPCRNYNELAGPLYRIGRRMIGYECLALNRIHLANILAPGKGKEYMKSPGEIPPWTIILCLGGGRRLPEKKLAYEEKALLLIAQDLKLEIHEQAGPLDFELLSKLRKPWEADPYWKHSSRGDAADFSFITTLDRFPICMNAFRDLLKKNKIKPDESGVYLQPLEYGRACHVEFSVPFDPASSAEKNAVENLEREAVSIIIDSGGFFPRPYGALAKSVYDTAMPYHVAMLKLKNIFDPKGIMNPGVLCD